MRVVKASERGPCEPRIGRERGAVWGVLRRQVCCDSGAEESVELGVPPRGPADALEERLARRRRLREAALTATNLRVIRRGPVCTGRCGADEDLEAGLAPACPATRARYSPNERGNACQTVKDCGGEPGHTRRARPAATDGGGLQAELQNRRGRPSSRPGVTVRGRLLIPGRSRRRRCRSLHACPRDRARKWPARRARRQLTQLACVAPAYLRPAPRPLRARPQRARGRARVPQRVPQCR